ncbi:uncharacterized protein LOC134550723 isoform X2 [Prinia subflava]|uniref:uncharacterized protein LOC134550723 isoform X2 n=1 Tax=Prinia subflava TaxID=208062 RepID=UPI002FE29637
METGGNAPRPRCHEARGQRDTGAWRRGQAPPDAPSTPRHGSCPSWDTVTNHQMDREAQGHTGSHNMPRTRATTPSTRRHTGRGHGGAMGTPTRTHGMAPRRDRRGRGSWGGKIRLKRGKMKAEEPAVGPLSEEAPVEPGMPVEVTDSGRESGREQKKGGAASSSAGLPGGNGREERGRMDGQTESPGQEDTPRRRAGATGDRLEGRSCETAFLGIRGWCRRRVRWLCRGSRSAQREDDATHRP